MAQFNVGDTVQLKSGGPIMTVETVEGDKVICDWFVNSTEVKRYVFKTQMLNAAE